MTLRESLSIVDMGVLVLAALALAVLAVFKSSPYRKSKNGFRIQREPRACHQRSQ